MDNNQFDIPSTKAELSKQARRPYHTPHLREHGNLQDLTKGAEGPHHDFDGTSNAGQNLIIIYKTPIAPYKPHLP